MLCFPSPPLLNVQSVCLIISILLCFYLLFPSLAKHKCIILCQIAIQNIFTPDILFSNCFVASTQRFQSSAKSWELLRPRFFSRLWKCTDFDVSMIVDTSIFLIDILSFFFRLLLRWLSRIIIILYNCGFILQSTTMMTRILFLSNHLLWKVIWNLPENMCGVWLRPNGTYEYFPLISLYADLHWQIRRWVKYDWKRLLHAIFASFFLDFRLCIFSPTRTVHQP